MEHGSPPFFNARILSTPNSVRPERLPGRASQPVSIGASNIHSYNASCSTHGKNGDRCNSAPGNPGDHRYARARESAGHSGVPADSGGSNIPWRSGTLRNAPPDSGCPGGGIRVRESAGHGDGSAGSVGGSIQRYGLHAHTHRPYRPTPICL